MIGNLSAKEKSEHISRRTFVERFVLVLAAYPLGRGILGSSAVAAIPARSNAHHIESAEVQFPASDTTIKGFLSHPKEKGPFPGVMVIDRYLNLVEHGRDVSRRLAAQGYAALTPDLLSRKGGTSAFAGPDAQRKALRTVTEQEALGDLDASFHYMASNALVKKNDVAVLGFEEGGQKAFLYATTNPQLKAAVIYYGSAPSDDKLASIQCPVLELVGDKDARIAPTVPVMQEKMKQLGKGFESKIFPGVDHGFFDETGERYNEAATKESWMVVLDFLKRNLH